MRLSHEPAERTPSATRQTPRLDFPFTERDTPPLRARITRDLTLVAKRVQERDPHLDALVLTGGFSRGEGSARDGAPLNDYDLVAIRRRPGGAAAYRALARELDAEVGLEVDLLPVHRARVPRVGRKLFWLDARLGGRVIVGDPFALERLPRFGASQLPRIEGARLLANRAAGLLLALPGTGETPDEAMCDLQATKAALAAMDATLLARGAYAAHMRERLDLVAGHPLRATFARAVRWKLAPPDVTLGGTWWREAADALLHAVDETRARDARDGLAEHVVHALRGGVAAQPSRRVRRAAWSLLAASRYPEGPADVEKARALVPRASDCGDWPSLKARFMRWRASTLQ